MWRCWILEWWLLCILSDSECTIEVHGTEGQNVTLPCKYDALSSGPQHTCWGKGPIPTTGGCSDEIISTDGIKVTNKASSRYQMIGDLMTGDVSLTIVDPTEKDSGIYGCRVQHTGWFNDERFHVTLTVNKAPVPTTPRTPDNVTNTSQTWDNHTHYYTHHSTGNSSPYSDTFSTHYIKSESEEMRLPFLFGILVSILLVLLGTVIVSALVLSKRWKRDAVDPKKPQVSGDTAEVVIDNIYQIEGNDQPDYEDCP